MTPPRDRAELVALMARAIYETHYGQPPDVDDEGMSHDEARSALAALEASGVALVPVVATKAMIQAAGASPDGVSARGGIDWLGRMLPRYWAAMVAKTPYAQPPEARSDD